MVPLDETWRSSRRSGQGECVEVRQVGGAIQVRDTKHRDGAVLTFTAAEWTAFTGGVRDGEFDLPE
jgi:hypothetical protein